MNADKKLANQKTASEKKDKSSKKKKKDKKEKKDLEALDFQKEFSDNEELLNEDVSVNNDDSGSLSKSSY